MAKFINLKGRKSVKVKMNPLKITIEVLYEDKEYPIEIKAESFGWESAQEELGKLQRFVEKKLSEEPEEVPY